MSEALQGHQPPISMPERLRQSGGVVLLEDLMDPRFNQIRSMKFTDYLAEIGTRMAAQPREGGRTDSALGVYGQDFEKAAPSYLKRGLYPKAKGARAPKLALTVHETTCDLDPGSFPGIQPPNVRVMVPGDIYRDVVRHAPSMAAQVYSGVLAKQGRLLGEQREKLRLGELEEEEAARIRENIEAVEDLAGEAVFYAFDDKMNTLYEHDDKLSDDTVIVKRIIRNSDPEIARPKRIFRLERYRRAADRIILNTVTLACLGHKMGTSETQSVRAAVISNIYRSNGDGPRMLQAYADLSLRNINATRGRINQSLNGCMGILAEYSSALINSVDRAYED
jgi:hypothetical protein